MSNENPTTSTRVPEQVNQKNWEVAWTVEKWESEEAYQAGLTPEVVSVKDNLLLTNGINLMLSLLCGLGGTAFSSGNARLRVGNGTTAASGTQLDLQGASQAEATMDAGYPSLSSATITFKSTYGTSDGNFAWEEVGVSNGTGAVVSSGQTVRVLNRKVQSFGTKASGAVWALTLAITIS
jgi:hypothetical protein